VNAVIYARISSDPTGMEAGVTRQLKECRLLATRLGFEVDEELVDNDISATNGKRRPQFERLLTMRPSVVIVWHQDRLLRLTKDLERVIEFDVPIYTVMSGSLDLSTPAGRAVARTIAAWSQYEGEQKAARLMAANRDRRERGLPSKAFPLRPFGYESDGMTHRPAEAAAIRAAFDAMVTGSHVAAIAPEWNRAGFRTAHDQPWTARSVFEVLANPHQMGKVTYKAKRPGLRTPRRVIVGDGVWEPIVDETTWRVVRRRLSRKPLRTLLARIATCGKVLESGETCGRPTYNGITNALPSYWCPCGHISRRAAYVDAQVTDWLLTRLARRDVRTRLRSGGDDATTMTRLERLRAREAAAESDLRSSGKVLPTDVSDLLAPLRAEILDLEEAVIRARHRPMIGHQLADRSAVEMWEGWNIFERRQAVETLALISIKPTPPGRGYRPSAVIIRPRS